MERRGLNIRKGFLRLWLPMIRALPLPVASRFVSGIGRMEYRFSHRLRGEFRQAVSRGRSILGCQWDVPDGEPGAGGQSRACGGRATCCSTASPTTAPARCSPSTGRENLDAAFGLGRGCIVLASHFGAHLLPAHWLFREGLPGPVLHGASPAHLAVPVAALRDRGPAGPGQAVHLPPGRPGRLGQLDPPRRPHAQGRDAALPGRRCPMDRAAHRAGPSSWAETCGSRRPGSCWPR